MAAEAAPGRAARFAWGALAAVAATLAAAGVARWIGVLWSGRPILYGEGAVAHAAILFRDGAAYRDASGAVAANYPPLYLALASLGDPFRVGRLVTIAASLAVALTLALRARGAGPVVSAAIGLAWLALAPVAVWGAAVKPDMLAVALTLGGVALLERAAEERTEWQRSTGAAPWVAGAAGALLALAAWTKPTAVLPAAAVLVWAVLRARAPARRALAGAAAVAAVAAVQTLGLGPADLWRHVVVWNELAWSAGQALLLAVLGAATLGVLVAAGALARAFRGIALAYLLGAVAVAALGGREGATINYLLDLAAAASFALASAAARTRAFGRLPAALVGQLVLGAALLAPYSVLPGRPLATGAWGRPERDDVVRGLGPGDHLVEDSGLLVADGRSPVVDDLFLWSRLARLGLIDPRPLIGRVRAGGLASVVSETDLARLDAAPEYERARWDPELVRAVLDRYALERRAAGLWVYRPR